MQVKLCKELENLKKQDRNKYEEIIRILRFLYKTVGEDFFDKKINSAKLSEEVYHASHIGGNTSLQKEIADYTEFKRDLFSRYIESNGGIIDMLFEIVKEDVFFNYFFEKVDIPMTTFECGIKQNTETYTYIYNLYAMLKIYQNKKDNFGAFKLAIDDIVYLFTETSVMHDPNSSDRKVLIDKIAANEFYPQNDLLRGLMVRMICEARQEVKESDKKNWNSMFTYLGELLRDKMKYGKLGYIGYTIKPEIFDIIARDVTLLVHSDLLPGCEPFYDPIILFGDRYKVLKENIKVVGVNHREEVYSYFVSLCPGLFDELNQDREKDIFNDCVEKIFDSDTYYELYRKLEILSQADEYFQKGDKKVAIEKIKILMTESFKETLLGSVLEFPTDNNNKIDKPNSIGERTKTLYLKHDLVPQDFNWDIIDSKGYGLQSLKERLDREAFEYNAQKQITVQEQAKPEPEEPKQKKKSRFSLFG